MILTWLSLSDFHFKGAPSWEQSVVLKALLRDVLTEVSRPDLVFIAGDIAHGGKREQYLQASQFFSEVAKATCTNPLESWFVVPGNHDVDRSQISHRATRLLRTIETLSDANEILSDHESRSIFLERQSEFFRFTAELLGPERAWSLSRPWRVDHCVVNGLRIAVLGLNSAWAAMGGDEDQARLILGEYQARDALEHAERRAHDLRIALMHHPLDWLRSFDRERVEQLLQGAEGAHVILRGHLHRGKAFRQASPDAQCLEIASGACWEHANFPHGVNYVRLDTERRRGEIHFFRYSAEGRGFWRPDNTIYENVKNGVWEFELPGAWIQNERANARDTDGDDSRVQEQHPEQVPVLQKHARTGEQLSLLDSLLGAAKNRRENLSRHKLSTAPVDDEIRELRRNIRSGVPLEKGDVIPTNGSAYILCDQLGYGGFGTVWRARRLSATEEYVAVKVLHGQYSRDATMIERFARGARVLGELSHENIVRLIEPYQEKNGYHLFVMEYIDGPTLQQFVLDDGFALADIPDLAQQICQAVTHAHNCGYIHRDIKPTNIILRSDGRTVCVTDFDLVMGYETSGGTREDNPMGTLAYAAPEQFENPESVTKAADVCSIAKCMIFMYLREPPSLEIIGAPGKVVRKIPSTEAVRTVLKRGASTLRTRFKSVREFWEAYADALTAADITDRGRLVVDAIPDAPIFLILAPCGDFLMGTSCEESDWDAVDESQHLVRLSSFAISETAVTQKHWRSIMGAASSAQFWFDNDAMPMIGVTWFDTISFCNRLSEIAGRRACYLLVEGDVVWDVSANGFRLPTESEWEYAARAGTSTAYSFGSTARRLNEYGWNGKKAKHQVHAVRLLQPNPWHLFDMHGNVREWVWDRYGDYPSNEAVDPKGPDEGRLRVLRGGNYEVDPIHLRSAARAAMHPSASVGTIGFRIATSVFQTGETREVIDDP